jgi:hypothetical protein
LLRAQLCLWVLPACSHAHVARHFNNASLAHALATVAHTHSLLLGLQARSAANTLSVGGMNVAVGQSVANAINGMATSTSDVNVKALLGDGRAISLSQANSIAGAALAQANGNCQSVGGGCVALSKVRAGAG